MCTEEDYTFKNKSEIQSEQIIPELEGEKKDTQKNRKPAQKNKPNPKSEML